MTKLVSIVVTTRNEEKNIGRCLQSVVNQTYKNFELIVIDNNSTDETTNIASSFTSLVFNMGPERSAQRNFGLLKVAKGQYLIYVDADMILTPELIQNCVKQMESEELDALFIPEIVLGRSFFAKIRRFERSFYNGTSIDAVRFFQKDVFLRSGGFDETLFRFGSGEDWDLDKKIRTLGKVSTLKPLVHDAAIAHWIAELISESNLKLNSRWVGILHNETEAKLLTYLKKKRYYASGFDGYISKWGKNDPDIKKQFGIIYRAIGVFFENGKWILVMKSPHLYISVLFLKFLVYFSTRSKWHRYGKTIS
jgi:glycosyltransferase involved in cell wall biosynthesis